MIRLRLATLFVATTAAVVLPATASLAMSDLLSTSNVVKTNTGGMCSDPDNCGACVDSDTPVSHAHWCTL